MQRSHTYTAYIYTACIYTHTYIHIHVYTRHIYILEKVHCMLSHGAVLGKEILHYIFEYISIILSSMLVLYFWVYSHALYFFFEYIYSYDLYGLEKGTMRRRQVHYVIIVIFELIVKGNEELAWPQIHYT